MAPSEPVGYDTSDRDSAKQQITPLIQAQMHQGELINELSGAIHKLADRLRPVISEESMDSETKLSSSGVDKPPRLGSSPALSMIELQCENLKSQIQMLNAIMRFLEV